MLGSLVLSIILLTLSFPTVIGAVHFPDLGFLVWIGWVPALVAVRKTGTKKIGRSAFVVCAGYYLVSMYWLFFAMHNFGGVGKPASFGVLVLLCLFIALYGATAFALAGFLERRWRVPLIFSLPLLWAISEWCREHFPLGGYPWSNLAYSLGHDLYAMQLSETIGVYGVSALILFVNIAIAEGVYSFWARKPRPYTWIVLALFLLMEIHFIGYLRFVAVDSRLRVLQNTQQPLSVALIQGNILQGEKWDPSEADRIRELYKTRSQNAFAAGAQLVIWPEAAYPYTINKNTPSPYPLPRGEGGRVTWFENWMQDGWHVLFGGLTRGYVNGLEADYNTALWASGGGQLVDQVDKVHLVPLGEYVPYREYLTFARALTQAVGDFYPGEKGHPLVTPLGRFGVLICYEDLFPDLAHALVKGGAQVLVNLTNDAWYEQSSAAYQHVVYSQYRALENRRYLLRATNTGITAIIDPLGRVVSSLPWYEEGILRGEVWRMSRKD